MPSGTPCACLRACGSYLPHFMFCSVLPFPSAGRYDTKLREVYGDGRPRATAARAAYAE